MVARIHRLSKTSILTATSASGTKSFVTRTLPTNMASATLLSTPPRVTATFAYSTTSIMLTNRSGVVAKVTPLLLTLPRMRDTSKLNLCHLCLLVITKSLQLTMTTTPSSTAALVLDHSSVKSMCGFLLELLRFLNQTKTKLLLLSRNRFQNTTFLQMVPSLPRHLHTHAPTPANPSDHD